MKTLEVFHPEWPAHAGDAVTSEAMVATGHANPQTYEGDGEWPWPTGPCIPTRVG